MVRKCGRYLVAGLLIAMVTSSCGQSGPGSASTAPETTVEVATGADARIPEDFPKDIPLPEDFTVEGVSAMPEQSTFVVQGRVTEPLETVAASLKDQILGQGWSEVESPGSQDIPDMTTMNFEKDGTRLNLTLFREEAETSVNLTVSPR